MQPVIALTAHKSQCKVQKLTHTQIYVVHFVCILWCARMYSNSVETFAYAIVQPTSIQRRINIWQCDYNVNIHMSKLAAVKSNSNATALNKCTHKKNEEKIGSKRDKILRNEKESINDRRI